MKFLGFPEFLKYLNFIKIADDNVVKVISTIELFQKKQDSFYLAKNLDKKKEKYNFYEDKRALRLTLKCIAIKLPHFIKF